MKSNSNEGTYIPETKYDNVKKKKYMHGWRYKADENELHIDIIRDVIKNVKKNRKKEKDNLGYREQNIYTNYTAPLGTNETQYLKKNEFDYETDYEANEVYAKSLKVSLQNKTNGIINRAKNLFVTQEKNKYGAKPLSYNESCDIETKMLKKAKEDKEVKKQIEQVKKEYETENIFNKIKQKPKFKIDKSTQHLNDYFFNHGSENRELILGNRCKDLVDYALLSHFYQIPNEQFEKLESFYFKSMACYGGYFDNQTNIFDEIQHKLKSIKGNKKPKCFVRLLKKEYAGWLTREQDKGEIGTEHHFKLLPVKEDVEEGKDEDLPLLDDIYDNPDNYFDYYYVEEDKIYKVLHDFVHNRKKLIDKDLLREEAIHTVMKLMDGVDTKENKNVVYPKTNCPPYKQKHNLCLYPEFNAFIHTKGFKQCLYENICFGKASEIKDKNQEFPEFYDKKIKNSVELRNEFYKYMQDHPL